MSHSHHRYTHHRSSHHGGFGVALTKLALTLLGGFARNKMAENAARKQQQRQHRS